ncbi:uncharacterized protein DNG_03689 [Cephalotrichum gorgonifer]|uniref:Uncharacterized protein n=1 Tax=Cephalotrichum gorgonifer TaxID=2041049 RepID=A0AAE8STU5_9PEZI|nr:uncharacterized protein DNG_03689 [Cephalotrichum gorgonifer]
MPTNFGTWKWEAPTPVEDRSGSPGGEPLFATTAESSWQFLRGCFSPGAEAPEPAGDRDDGLNAVEDDVYRDMHWLAEQIKSLGLHEIKPSVDIFTDGLAAQAANGNLTPDHLYQILATLPGELTAKYGHSKASLSLVAQLLNTIDRVITSAGSIRREYFEYRFWNTFLNRILLLDGQRTACALFGKIMEKVPYQYLDHLDDAVGAVLVSVSRRLARFGREAHLGFLKKLVATAIHSVDPQKSHIVRVFWLSVIARIPDVRQDFMLQAMAEYSSADSWAEELSDVDICRLLRLQWISRGYVPKKAQLSLPTSSTGEETALARFAHAICSELEMARHIPTLKSLCRCLSQMGRLHSLAGSFEALCLESNRLSARPMAIVASRCEDYTLAMALHGLTRVHAKLFSGGPRVIARDWNWHLWAGYTAKLAKDPSIDPRQLRALLRVDPRWVRHHDLGRPTLSQSTVDLLETSARDIVTYFTNTAVPGRRLERTALHLVETRIRYLRAHDVKLGPRIISALTQLLTLDLVAGGQGRKTRFRWLLGLIEAYQSPEAAEAAGRALSRWRMLNAQATHRRLATEVQRQNLEVQTMGGCRVGNVAAGVATWADEDVDESVWKE